MGFAGDGADFGAAAEFASGWRCAGGFCRFRLLIWAWKIRCYIWSHSLSATRPGDGEGLIGMTGKLETIPAPA
jgi:hypothetical protein